MDSARKQEWAAADELWQGRKDLHRVLEGTCLNVAVYVCLYVRVGMSICGEGGHVKVCGRGVYVSVDV